MSSRPKGPHGNVRVVGGEESRAVQRGDSRAVTNPTPGLRRGDRSVGTGKASKAKRAAAPPALVVAWRPPDLDKIVESWVEDDKPTMSVIFGTYNRIGKLQDCVASVRRSVGPISYEIVITDGGSTDGSIPWMEAQDDIVLVKAGRLEGAVKAFNQAYSASKGHYVALLNDDVIAVGDALLLAVARLKTDDSIGQVACAWGERKKPFSVAAVHGTIYANLGVMPRRIADLVVKITGGVWCPKYYTYGADTELSCWVHRVGLKVYGLKNSCFEDLPVLDALRRRNETRARNDGKLFYKRWPMANTLLPGGPFPNVTGRELSRLRQVMKEGLP